MDSEAQGEQKQVDELSHAALKEPLDANTFSQKLFTKLEKVPPKFPRNYIFCVDDSVRHGNESFYEPLMFSIGPYNRGKKNLQQMEEYKYQCLNRTIKAATARRSISKSDLMKECYKVLKEVEDECRSYYAHDICLNSHEFLEMLLLDGCFIIDVLQRPSQREDDPLLNIGRVRENLRRDLLLLENQLPFFVLQTLIKVMANGDDEHPLQPFLWAVLNFTIHFSIRPIALATRDYMITMLSIAQLSRGDRGIINGDFPNVPDETKKSINALQPEERRPVDPEKLKNTKHLLDLMYKVLLKEEMLDFIPEVQTTIRASPEHSTLLGAAYFNTHSATELTNAGVRFKRVEKKKFYDIQFKNGTLEIPVISFVTFNTEGLLRNLIAYEICDYGSESRYILSDYVLFMDSLISSAEDVELLRMHGIIEHLAGEDEAISTFFNKTTKFTRMPDNYYYSSIVKDLKAHSSQRRHVWMAKLRSEYFNGPWTSISVLAAMVLLALTFVQTAYSVFQYNKDRNSPGN